MIGDASHMHRTLGILTYDQQPFTNSLIERLQNAMPELRITAYPCFYHPSQEGTSFLVVPSNVRARPFGVEGRGVREAFTSSFNLSAAWRITAENEIVMLYGLQGVTALLVVLFGVIRGCRIISVNHSLGPEMELRRRWWIRLLKKWLLTSCDWHVCQMPAAKVTLQTVYGLSPSTMSDAPFEGGASLYRPMTIDRVRRRAATRSRLRVSDETTVFLFVGNIIPLKGPGLFVRALAALESLQSVGILAGPEEPGYGEEGTIAYYEALAASLGVRERVVLTGRMDSEQLADLYAGADVLVLPTFKDCMPKVFIEAALFGLPIVTTDAPGSVGILPNPGVNGYAVPVGDLGALTRAMTELENPVVRQRFSGAALEAVEEFCNADKETGGFVAAIGSVLAMRKVSSKDVAND